MWKIPFVFSIIVKNAENFKQISLFLKNTCNFRLGKSLWKECVGFVEKGEFYTVKNQKKIFQFWFLKRKTKNNKGCPQIYQECGKEKEHFHRTVENFFVL